VALRVEEHLDMPDIVGVRAFEVGPGQIIEILLRDEHGHGLIVDVEKVLQVAEPVRLPQRLDRWVGQADAVAARQREYHFGLEAALDVNVQLAFGKPLDQTVRVLHS
jgi:EAL domain-containing protein (putative c-di-GMP-specific phosphodiesterase class I)